MRFTILMLAFVSTTAIAGRRSRNQAPPPEPPIAPVSQTAAFDEPPPGSWMSTSAAWRGAGLDGLGRIPGDVVTVRLSEQTITQLDADTESAVASSQAGSIGSIFGISNPLAIGGGSGDLGISTSRQSSFDGAGRTRRGSRIDSVVSCTITDIIRPVNDYQIWCSKQVSVNKETQWVVLTGRVRARDIAIDNTVPSDRVAHAKIEVSGRGVVADKQRPGLLARVLDKLWPF